MRERRHRMLLMVVLVLGYGAKVTQSKIFKHTYTHINFSKLHMTYFMRVWVKEKYNFSFCPRKQSV